MKAEETWAEQATYMYDFHIQELQETGSMWEKLLKKYLGNIPGKKVLDTGCGTGFLSVILAKNGWKVTAIDNSSVLAHAFVWRCYLHNECCRLAFLRIYIEISHIIMYFDF